MEPGPYCFQGDGDILKGAKVELLLAKDQTASGRIQGTMDNAAKGYTNASFYQSFSGELRGQTLKVGTETEIEESRKTSQETWTFTPEQLTTSYGQFSGVNCGQFIKAPAPEDSGFNDRPPQRVKFPAGANNTTVENSVIRGDRDIYLIEANAKQDMKLNITALEDNAVFDVVAPNGDYIEQELTNLDFTLPMGGDYKIMVSGTRGNASYKLSIQIK